MKPHVLVLDDEPWQLSWVADVLRPSMGTVTFTSTFDEATAAFDARPPDVAIIDIRIGEVDGPLLGRTLSGADPDWTGLRFLRFIRVDRKSKAATFVYTGLDRDDLQTIVEGSYQARFYTKFEAPYFRRALEKEIAALAKKP